MDYRNIVIGAMVLIIALMVGFNVALYMGAQDQNVTQLDWSNNATTDMSFANESPAPVSTDNTKTATNKIKPRTNNSAENGTETSEPEAPAENQTT
ncbi:MAG: hypothetical protein NQU45_03030 [Methanothermobacter sp.]|uniref:hypothetical protein n=1 Tax=Methanothermobacter thermautotrophicus TaxID=145262 RepID=UPI001865DAFB|nr:hypothetical protein [Methanothermobacter thermautotrophicus]MCQ8904674.1 hypothetical protein [Methanothermobacter sp.]